MAAYGMFGPVHEHLAARARRGVSAMAAEGPQAAQPRRGLCVGVPHAGRAGPLRHRLHDRRAGRQRPERHPAPRPGRREVDDLPRRGEGAPGRAQPDRQGRVGRPVQAAARRLPRRVDGRAPARRRRPSPATARTSGCTSTPYLGALPLNRADGGPDRRALPPARGQRARDGRGEATGSRCQPGRSGTCTRSCRPRSAPPSSPGASRATRPPTATRRPRSRRRRRRCTPGRPAQLAAFLAWAQQDGHAHAPARGTCSPTPACAAARPSRCAGVTSTSTRARSASAGRPGMIRNAGEGAEVTEGDTKSGKPRVVDLDPATVAVLRAHRKARGAMALQLARTTPWCSPTTRDGTCSPEHFSRSFADALRRCARQLGAAAPPAIRLHDLRHTHATVLLTAGVPVHVVSQRLGHASPVVTLTVYAHVVPGQPARGRRPVRAPDRGGGVMNYRAEASERHHGPVRAGSPVLSPAEMSCPRGDLNPHALLGH